MWSGSTVDHFSGKRDTARSWLQDEEQPRIREWITRYIADLDALIKDEEIREEREQW